MGRRPKYAGPGIRISSTRDLRILTFIWKWKVTTSAVLMHKFFAGVSPFTAYRRLWKLAKAGFIESRSDCTGQKFVWMLGQRGFTVVKERLPFELKEEGYKSECLGHDLVVAAFHLGSWVSGAPENVEIVTEQQLRRCNAEDLPLQYDTIEGHRPDGFTFIKLPDGKYQGFAIEVELNVKTVEHYHRLSSRYHCFSGDTLWLTADVTSANRIWHHLKYCNSDGWQRHSFVTLSQFQKLGWDAAFDCGKYQGQSIHQVMHQGAQNCVKTTSQPVSNSLTLNLAKTPHKSKGSKHYEIGNFSK